MLNIIVSIFGLGRSYRNIRSERSLVNIWKRFWKRLKIYIQNLRRNLGIHSIFEKLSRAYFWNFDKQWEYDTLSRDTLPTEYCVDFLKHNRFRVCILGLHPLLDGIDFADPFVNGMLFCMCFHYITIFITSVEGEKSGLV